MNCKSLIGLISLTLCFGVLAESTETTPNNDPYFSSLLLLKAPKPKGPLLQPGDRLAICGDSITEQRMYSRIIETYLTVALPELNISTRQYGWGGEQASGFLGRMTNDVLRFHPTVATTCYGMNDHHYRPYAPSIGQAYASNMTDIVLAFKDDGARVIAGSPGCMGLGNPPWANLLGTPLERNTSLCLLRDIDIEISQAEDTGFADVFWDMYLAQYFAGQWYGTNYALAGKDFVHPGWAGHLVMAYAFLKAMDVPGEIGTFTVDLAHNQARVSRGHQLLSFTNGTLTIKSTRYPFCATGPDNRNDSIRSGMTLVPFNQELNRLILVVKGGHAQNYQITWGDSFRPYSAESLRRGVNLAADFAVNPFSGPFAAVDQAVARKQSFETQQVKQLFHGPDASTNMDRIVTESEKDRQVLVDAIKTAFVPVTHTITITPQ